MGFGWRFGWALYDKEHRHVAAPDRRTERRQLAAPAAPIDEGFDAPQPQRPPTTSQRAVTAVARPDNGRDRGGLPY